MLLAPVSAIPVCVCGMGGVGLLRTTSEKESLVVDGKSHKLALFFSCAAVPHRHSSQPLLAVLPPMVFARVAPRLSAGKLGALQVALEWPGPTL